MSIKKMLKNNSDLYYFIYKLYLPLKNIKNKDRYEKHYLNVIDKITNNKERKKIFYVGVPIHNNLGDQAQYYCIKKWLMNNYPDYEVIEVTDNIIYTNYKKIIKHLKNIINETDFFVFQSGYRTTDVANFEGEYAHQVILKNFNNKVIVFPQTVNFRSKKEFKKNIDAYKKHNNYIFLARDKYSYDCIKGLYDEKRVLLYPDIVTSMIGNCSFLNDSKNRNGILMCLRNDEEKLYSNNVYDILISKLKGITDKIDITDTNSSENFEYNRQNVEFELNKKFIQFSNYKVVVTDRYHGTIFGLINNCKVIVLNSTDHKLSSGVDWFKGVYDNNIYYCSDINDVYNIVSEIYGKESNEKLQPYFNQEYYDKLKEKIDEVCK